MALNILELADTLASGNEKIIEEDNILLLNVRLCFLTLNQDLKRKAYRLLMSDHEQVRRIWKTLMVHDSKMEEYWPYWIHHAGKWLSSFYRFGLPLDITHKELFEDLIGFPHK
jgi:hypothetical protein